MHRIVKDSDCSADPESELATMQQSNESALTAIMLENTCVWDLDSVKMIESCR